ncbi:FtsL-like putative cell division protein [Chitinophagaceae bacterium MMS25-I14]
MSAEQNITEQQAEITPVQRIRNDWKALLEKVSYRGIVRNIPFLAFVALLGIVYISNSQKAVAVQRELNKHEKELKELRWKYMDIKSKLMNAGMETELIRKGADVGLKPLMLPAYKIEADSNNVK